MFYVAFSIYLYGLAPVFFYLIFRKLREEMDITAAGLLAILIASFLPFLRELIVIVSYDRVVFKKNPS